MTKSLFICLFALIFANEYCSCKKQRTIVPFPETIWLGGIIPYKLDRSFKIIVEKLLSETVDANNEKLFGTFRKANKQEQENIAKLEARLKPIFTSSDVETIEENTITVQNVTTPSNGTIGIVDQISVDLEPTENVTQGLIVLLEELFGDIRPEAATNSTNSTGLEDGEALLEGQNVTMSNETMELIDDGDLLTDSTNSTDTDETAHEHKRRGYDPSILIFKAVDDDRTNITSKEIDTNVNETDTKHQQETAATSEVPVTEKSERKSTDCSRIKEILDTPNGRASIFEHALSDLSSDAELATKSLLSRLAKMVHHVMTVKELDTNHKHQLVSHMTSNLLQHNPLIQNMLMPISLPNFGNMSDFFNCLWVDELEDFL